MIDYAAFEVATGLSFRDKSLLQRALTHRSYLNESPHFPLSDNERLEFLGDAILDSLVALYLYHRFPEQREGVLTNLRAALVRRKTLARFAQELQLGRFLLMGYGEAESGGREREAVLCATFEALVGALYLDQGWEAVRNLVEPMLLPEIKHFQGEIQQKDPKSRLQEWSQANLQQTPQYITVEAYGPDHAKTFVVEVVIGGKVYGRGEGRSKQIAAQAAAEEALAHLDADNGMLLDQNQ